MRFFSGWPKRNCSKERPILNAVHSPISLDPAVLLQPEVRSEVVSIHTMLRFWNFVNPTLSGTISWERKKLRPDLEIELC